MRAPFDTVPASPPVAVIDLRDVTKVFVTEQVETHALSRIHLSIRPREWVAIVGPSGSGKSTLLAILGLLDTPTRGEYWLGGRNTSALGSRERAWLRSSTIGFVFQSFHLIGELTILENVELPLKYRGLQAPERRRRAMESLEQVGMSHRARHFPGQLSGGEQQRAAIARAIAGAPELILADEPTGNLDSRNGDTVIALLSGLHAAGSTICMVTHDPAIARHASRTVELLDGAIPTEPSPEPLP